MATHPFEQARLLTLIDEALQDIEKSTGSLASVNA